MSLLSMLTPLDCALLLILVYLVKSVGTNQQSRIPPPQHPADPIVMRNYTPLELQAFSGKDGGRVYMAVFGDVYDVSAGRSFYGPGGPYENFAGRDASRGLSKNSFDVEMLADPKGPIDKLQDLDDEERQTGREWAALFASKYIHIGSLVENEKS
ncbi:hypothetical protein PhCBS80983_g01237 [Powellomyces hirtus]|uniref:Cytochrome b5 heme-binding domain-containing protein n=1 Tax=Powellomyces hirtus TaxID=109895 RepID=A0A507ECV5_9FUNG|nr:hypothetical protein PhCBS80983_g01237 [Powellomyces hirtus]